MEREKQIQSAVDIWPGGIGCGPVVLAVARWCWLRPGGVEFNRVFAPKCCSLSVFYCVFAHTCAKNLIKHC